MAEIGTFQAGDAVVHPRRPEWGAGRVDQATRIEYEGVTAQRLVVTFEHHGRVTINTAVAPLLPKGNHSQMSTTTTRGYSNRATGGGWLDTLGEKAPHGSELWRLPEAMVDPFISIAKRLTATLESYRFSTEPRSLIDWAVAQTGLSDPLSKYTRHELEQGFQRFARDRELHLVELVRNMKRQNMLGVLNAALQTAAVPAARNALQKAMRA